MYIHIVAFSHQLLFVQLIDEQDECTSLVTLTAAQYIAKTNDEKEAYRKSQERCGWNIGYDKTYAFYKDQGYRQGFDIEYWNKIDANTVNPDYVPIGLPSLLLPEDPYPKPFEIVFEADLNWYATKYEEGWNEGMEKGLADGNSEGKKAGKLAREASDDYQFAYESGYKKGFNDASLGLSAIHDPLSRNRQLRSVERQMREQYSNGYSEGYNEAKEAEEERELFSVERHLVSGTCTLRCQARLGDTTLSATQYKHCQILIPQYCPGRRLQVDYEWSHVLTLPNDGASGGQDFKNMIAHVISNKCRVEEVVFEVWKMCPTISS
jgi:hypothetical protein